MISLATIDELLLGSLEDVTAFISFLQDCLGLGYHPDTPFEDYIAANDKPTFTAEQAKILNELMEACFSICDQNNKDIYEIGLDRHLGTVNSFKKAN